MAPSCITAVTRKTNRPIKPGELFLIDSAANTRTAPPTSPATIAVGTPTDEMRTRFTQVLKGHIAVARAVFPDGTSGAQLGTLARQYLWQAGVDFEHGTGHGVGSYLSVHEGPARDFKLGSVPLKRGMILSNEPGYYKAGWLRHPYRNLILVIAAPAITGAEKTMNAFETITLAPIDRRLINVSLMTAGEIAWLDGYHARVAETIAPLVDKDTQAWLRGSDPAAGRQLTDFFRGCIDPKGCSGSSRSELTSSTDRPDRAADGDERDRPGVAQHPDAGHAEPCRHLRNAGRNRSTDTVALSCGTGNLAIAARSAV